METKVITWTRDLVLLLVIKKDRNCNGIANLISHSTDRSQEKMSSNSTSALELFLTHLTDLLHVMEWKLQLNHVPKETFKAKFLNTLLSKTNENQQIGNRFQQTLTEGLQWPYTGRHSTEGMQSLAQGRNFLKLMQEADMQYMSSGLG